MAIISDLSLSYLIVFNERAIVQIADKIPSEMVHCLNYMSEISCSKYMYLCMCIHKGRIVS